MHSIYQKHIGWLEFPDDDVVMQYLNEGWFEYTETAFIFSFLRGGDSFLDIGAHVGTHSASARKAIGKKGRVICVEPNTNLHPYLKANVSGVEIVACAVSNEEGQIDFAVSDSSQTSFGHALPDDSTANDNASHNQITRVPAKTIATLLSEIDAQQLALVKVDIEGMEHALFNGDTKSLIESEAVLIVEFSKENLERYGHTTNDLEQSISAAGYHICEYRGSENTLVKAELEHPVWYMNYFLCQNIDEVNRKLAKRTPARTRICGDVLRQGVASKELYESKITLDKERVLVADVCSHLESLTRHIQSNGTEDIDPKSGNDRSTANSVYRLQQLFGSTKSAMVYNLSVMKEKQKEIHSAAAQLQNSDSHVSSLKADLEKSEGQLTQLRSSHDTAQDLRNQIVQLEQITAAVTQRMDESDNHSKLASDAINEQSKSITEVLHELGTTKAQLEKSSAELTTATSGIANLYAELASAAEEIKLYKSQLADAQQAFDEKDEQARSFSSEITELSRLVETAEIVDAEKSTTISELELELTSLGQVTEQKEHRIQSQDAQLRELRAESSRLEDDLTARDAQLQTQTMTHNERISNAVRLLMQARQSRWLRLGSRLRFRVNQILETTIRQLNGL